jgi:hypothetical protein
VNSSSYYKQYLSKIKKLVGLEIKENTYNKWEAEAFLKWKKKTDYPEELSLQFLDDFDYYLKTEKKQEQISTKPFKDLEPLKRAISEGYLIEIHLYFISLKLFVKPSYFLSTEELKPLKKQCYNKRLSTIKDFLSSVATQDLPIMKWQI